MAQLFGFTGSPKTVNAGGTRLYWSTNTSGLSIGPDGSRVSYSQTLPSSMPPLNQQDGYFANLAQQFLQKNNLLPARARLSLPQVRYFNPTTQAEEGLNYTDRAQATAIELTYTPALDGLPLYTEYPSDSVIVFRYDAAGKMFHFFSPLYPALIKSNATFPVVSTEEAKRRLMSGGGALLYVFADEDINAHDTKQYLFTISKIESTELAYYYERMKRVILPVYVFRGLAKDKNTNKDIKTTSFVLALP